MKIYLSGPIKNDPDYRLHFDQAEKILKEKYPHYEIYSPAKLTDSLKRALKIMLECDCVIVLPSIGSYTSWRTITEQLVARETGISVWTLEEYLKPPPF
ncbi:MAG: DUF4406 domain-containing protein [Treponema sp.]|nr:DUF4406 domain-containing protein [Treponema sp.]